MPLFRIEFATLIARLGTLYGELAPWPSSDPFELILWENVGYLVSDQRRRQAYSRLRELTGLEPERLLTVAANALRTAIQDAGMHPDRRAAKLVRAAEIALAIGLDRLRDQVTRGTTEAPELLKRFPGIGDPGADKLRMVAGSARTIAPTATMVRLLTRLGFGQEAKSYSTTYRSVVDAVADELPETTVELIQAHHLLHRHGQAICQRSQPACESCPARPECRYFASL